MRNKTTETSQRLTDLQRIRLLEEFFAETGVPKYRLEDRARVSRKTVYEVLKGTRRMYLDTWQRLERAMEDYRREVNAAA